MTDIQKGWTRFSKPFGDLSLLTTEDWDKTFAVNVKANAFLMREAQTIMHSNVDGGAFIITSSIAAVYESGSSMAYAVSKAAQKHLMRCMASTQGPKVRVNAVLPGLLLTEWGKEYSQELIDGMKDKAWLKMTVS
jgi:NAD(P)-dependent dehydrogenase (short-subunit alcohol dehydrogenase family)